MIGLMATPLSPAGIDIAHAGRTLAAAAIAFLSVAGPTAATEAGDKSRDYWNEPHLAPERPYPGDRIGVPLFTQSCRFDPSTKSAARVRLLSVDPSSGPVYLSHQWELEYDLEPSTAPCGVPPPDHYAALADIGPLPPGTHRFEVRAMRDGQEYRRYHAGMVWVGEQSEPGEDLSGLWNSPDHPGSGLLVMRSGRRFTAVWTHHAAAGQPTWLFMSYEAPSGNRFDGVAYVTRGIGLSGFAGPAASEIWGTASFVYLGCGRASFQWNARDPSIPDGTRSLSQLGLPDGVTPCNISERVVGPPARRVGSAAIPATN
jgi:hypothetical protein